MLTPTQTEALGYIIEHGDLDGFRLKGVVAKGILTALVREGAIDKTFKPKMPCDTRASEPKGVTETVTKQIRYGDTTLDVCTDIPRPTPGRGRTTKWFDTVANLPVDGCVFVPVDLDEAKKQAMSLTNRYNPKRFTAGLSAGRDGDPIVGIWRNKDREPKEG